MDNKNFYTIEGPEGSGKTTIGKLLSEYLKHTKAKEVVLTREPGGVDIAEQIRNVILSTGNTAMDGRTEALLYAATRRQHLVEKIIPALEQGKIVLCDRFIDSSLAYQGYGRGLGYEEIMAINEFATGGILPNKTIFLNLSPKQGLERIGKDKGREVNRLDMEKLEFHEKVYRGYFEVINKHPERFLVVDATQEPMQVLTEIVKGLSW